MSLLNDKAVSSAPAGTLERRSSSGRRRHWRGLEELAETPEYKEIVEREFPAFASELLSPVTRRTFINLMGASVALAGMVSGCRRPEHHIFPYSKQPENITPGMPNFYATSFESAGHVVGCIARTFEGRPVKLEGNPDFPTTLGALDMLTQALILQLYDPDRSQFPRNKGQEVETDSARQALAGLGGAARANRGAGMRILSESTTSPSLLAQRQTLLSALPEARWHVWEPINHDTEHAGTAAALGRPMRAHYDFNTANVVVSLDSDFLSSGANSILNQKQFNRRRKPELGPMNRLYSIECMFTPTGAMADHRLRLTPQQVEVFAVLLANQLGADLAGANAASLGSEADKFIAALAKDIRGNAGKAAFITGAHGSPALHAIAALLNQAHGGQCVSFAPAGSDINQLASLTELTQAINAGHVQTLVILDGNPAYNAPADLKFAESLKRVRETIHLSLYNDETSQLCAWHIPQAHVLESWGDVAAPDGTIGFTQPLIAPLFNGLTAGELLSILSESQPRSAFEILYQFHRSSAAEDKFDPQWQQWLHDGMAPRPQSSPLIPAGSATVSMSGIAPLIGTIKGGAADRENLSLQLLCSPTLYDGRFANNGWLMEMPHPTTKLTWDNAAYMSQRTAHERGMKNEDIVEIKISEKTGLELPVWILPGIADFCIVADLGYGRTAGGRIANGAGANTYELRTSKALHNIAGVKAAKMSRNYQLANTQLHWSLRTDRPLVLEGSESEFRKNPAEIAKAAEVEEGGEHGTPDHKAGEPNLSPFQEHSYEHGPQWGMSIDLSACTGCGACTIACMAENNIPIVGKAQVRNGREMHWIRIDRYFATESDDKPADGADMVMQPMPCQHCENAPCEQVCPVTATTHSPDGINEMTYNRCIGTRYCSNNCPFKVRRFNFFNYQETYLQRGGKESLAPTRDGAMSHVLGATGGNPDLIAMARNPDVTVRSRGVMEKCTFCVQRIRRTTQEAKVSGHKIKDGEIKTACQQTCPSEAISFGDIRDAQSEISKMKENPRNYELLKWMNIKPRISYLARLRNPNPELVA